MSFVVFSTASGHRLPGQAVLTDFTDTKDDWRINSLELQPYAEFCPPNFWGRMSEDSPDDTLLYDVVSNTSNYIILIDSLKEFIEARVTDAMEFLPLTVLNHSYTASKEQYWVLNPLEKADCIDFDNSILEFKAHKPDIVDFIEELAMDEDKLKKIDKKIFLPDRCNHFVMFAESLTKEIDEAGFTNIRWKPPENVSDLDPGR